MPTKMSLIQVWDVFLSNYPDSFASFQENTCNQLMQRTLNPLNSLVLKKYDGFNMDELWFLDHVKMIPFTLAPLGIKSHPLPKTIPPTKNRPENPMWMGWYLHLQTAVSFGKDAFRASRNAPSQPWSFVWFWAKAGQAEHLEHQIGV